jgi:uncharacterized membrane protein YbaN (DUF454 family)
MNEPTSSWLKDMLTVVKERRECAKKKKKEECKTIVYIMIFSLWKKEGKQT